MSLRRNIAFFGIKRSGNHATQNWILNQIPEDTCVFNQAGLGLNPINTNQFRVYQTEALALDGRRLTGATYDGPVGNNSIFYTYENIELSNIQDGIPMGNQNLSSLGSFDYNANIIVLRDPFNVLASLFKTYSATPAGNMIPAPSKYISLWKSHAKEYLGITSFLKSENTLKIPISYNAWFTSEEYRRSVSEKMNLEFSDAGLQYVNRFGEGSSFDKQKYVNDAQKMKVLTRWKQVQDTSGAWQTILNTLKGDKELMEYVTEIFDLESLEIVNKRGKFK